MANKAFLGYLLLSSLVISLVKAIPIPTNGKAPQWSPPHGGQHQHPQQPAHSGGSGLSSQGSCSPNTQFCPSDKAKIAAQMREALADTASSSNMHRPPSPSPSRPPQDPSRKRPAPAETRPWLKPHNDPGASSSGAAHAPPSPKRPAPSPAGPQSPPKWPPSPANSGNQRDGQFRKINPEGAKLDWLALQARKGRKGP